MLDMVIEKLNHEKFPQYSREFHWLVGGILGLEPVIAFAGREPIRCLHITITADCQILAGELGSEVHVCHANDFDRHLTGLVIEAGLTQAEKLKLGQLYRLRVIDHRLHVGLNEDRFLEEVCGCEAIANDSRRMVAGWRSWPRRPRG